jgi:predicted amidohydrolase
LPERVFAVDVLTCERCGGRLRVVEIAKKPNDVARVLDERGWARAPPRAPPIAALSACIDGQLRLAFGEAASGQPGGWNGCAGRRARGDRDKDELVVAEMDLDLIEEVRRTWQFFRGRRPETYGDMVEQLP